jgi:hypothetical protein
MEWVVLASNATGFKIEKITNLIHLKHQQQYQI